MPFKIVILATYIFEEGPWPAPITEHWEGRLWTQHCLPDSWSDTMQRLQGCLCGTSQTHLLAKKFVITQITQVQVSAGSAVGDISIQQGDQAAIHGVTGQKKN